MKKKREKIKRQVNKFLDKDAKKFTLDEIIQDNYPHAELYRMKHGGKKPTEQEVINYLLNEQWKAHKM